MVAEVKDQAEKLLAYADLLNLLRPYGLEGVKDALRRFDEGLRKVEEIKKVDKLIAVRLIKTPDDLIVWLYTEPEFGAAVNVVYPDLSEWAWLPHYRTVATVTAVRGA